MIVFLCGGGRRVGWGHVGRCLRLAEALRNRGLRSRFLIRGRQPEPRRFAGASGFPAARYGGRAADVAARLLRGARAVVVDDYERGPALLRRIASLRPVLPRVAVDDLGRPLDADLVIDPCPGAAGRRARGRFVAGPRYSFVPGGPSRYRAHRVPRVLVALGGDGSRLAGRVLAALARLGRPVEAWLAGVRRVPAQRNRDGLLRVRTLPVAWDFWRRMPAVDLAICAGGGTCLEAAARGLPLLLIERAANQRGNIAALRRAGAARGIPGGARAPVGRIREALRSLLSRPAERARMSAAGRRLLDGRGPDRAAAGILDLLACRRAEDLAGARRKR